jgi:hypothetical protein
MSTLYFARIPFTYANQDLERGEILELKGSPRDDQLRGLKYFLAFDSSEHTKNRCDMCGKEFCSEGFYLTHKRKRGGCLAPSPDITKSETAMLLDMDPKKVIVEE